MIAPRGNILDREGNVLVDNRTSLALQLNTRKLPADPAEEKASDTARAARPHVAAQGAADDRRTGRSRRRGAGDAAQGRRLRPRLLPGREPAPLPRRHRAAGLRPRLPDGSRAAHLVGSVGEVSEEELKEAPYKRLEPGDEVGKGGVEYTYDKYLRGEPGLTKIQVNALGQPTPGGQLVSEPPAPGDNLKLTIDPEVQAAGESALASRGLPGAFVTMNVHNGQMLGLGSFPTFDPTVFTEPMTQAQVNALYRDPVLAPLTDRATEGYYPTGSTFKLVTALAALEGGRDHALDDDLRRRQTDRRHPELPERRRRLLRGADPGPGPGSLLRRLLLQPRSRHVEDQPTAGLGGEAGDRQRVGP